MLKKVFNVFSKFKINTIFVSLIFIASMFLGVEYAQISNSLLLSGNVTLNPYLGVLLMLFQIILVLL